MRNNRRNFLNNQNEAGWISTTDVFIFGSVFLLLLAVASLRERDSALVKMQAQSKALKLISQKANSLPLVPSELRDRIVELEEALATHESSSEVLGNVRTNLIQQQVENTRLKKLLNMEVQKVSSVTATAAQAEESLQNAIQELTNEKALALATFQAKQRKLNNKLVGLGGRLKKVVLMVDISASMAEENNWKPTLLTIERWIENLDVEEASLITFGTEAEELFAMQKLTDASRDLLLRRLNSVKPDADATNFLAAFQKAYDIPNVDTIIIFSDGLPSVDVKGLKIRGRQQDENSEAWKARLAQNIDRVLAVQMKVLQMAKAHPQVAINSIGLGPRVSSKEVGNLLNQLALANNGIFIAMKSGIR